MSILRRIDSLSRIVLPIEVKEALKVKEGDIISITVKGSSATMHKLAENKCIMCDCTDAAKLVNIGSKYICSDCITILNRDLVSKK